VHTRVLAGVVFLVAELAHSCFDLLAFGGRALAFRELLELKGVGDFVVVD